MQVVEAHGRPATVLTRRRRRTPSSSCATRWPSGVGAAVLRRGRRGRRAARPTSPARSPPWSTRARAAGPAYDLVLLGNDAADTGDFQVGIRLAYELGRPVVNGVEDRRGRRTAGSSPAGDGPDGVEIYEVPLPAVVTVLEGGVEPRYPSVPGRMKAKKAPVERAPPSAQPAGPGGCGSTLPPAETEHGRDARRGPGGRARGRRPASRSWGGGAMILVGLVETDDGRASTRGVAARR